METLVGQYFHSIEDGYLQWQGTVIGNPEPGWYLLQLFAWGMGEPCVRRLVHISDMKDWLFYAGLDDMKYSHDYGVARRGGPYQQETWREE